MKLVNTVRTAKRYTSCLLLSLAVVYCCGSFAQVEVEVEVEVDRKVIPVYPGEHPDFTIARSYQKNRNKYPFISPIQRQATGNFIAHEGLSYRRVEQRQLRLDLYQPTDNTKAHPLVLLIHGGGWRSGDRSHQVPMAQALAAAGFVAVAVEYRLSREALYPAAIDDLQQAIKWLRQRHQQYAINPDKLAVLGASSGAHLAALLGSTAHLANFAGLDNQAGAIQAIINLDGVVELTSPYARRFEDKPNKVSYMALWLGGRYQELPKLWQEVSPLEYTGPQTPPTLFVNSSNARFHAGRDDFVAMLKKNNIYSEVHTLPETPHPYWLFHPWFDNTRELVVRFLNRVFHQQEKLAQQTQTALDHGAINKLPPSQKKHWLQYLSDSQYLKAKDQSLLSNELHAAKLAKAMPAVKITKHSKLAKQLSGPAVHWLDASTINNMLSYQTASGGWSKGTDIYSKARKTGQNFGTETHFVPTFDNGATFQQVRLLSKAYQANNNGTVKTRLERSLRQAINLLLKAQYPNGGWPQTYPLVGGYHDLNTYNDDTISNALNLLLDIAESPHHFGIDNNTQARIQRAIDKAVNNILADQYWLSAKQGGWGQQHDPLSHELRGARAFEMAALATMESAKLLSALMRIKQPCAELQKSIDGGIRWLKQSRITGIRWQRYTDKPSKLIAAKDAPTLWPRMIDPKTQTAVFGDRDGSVHQQVATISIERQNKYAWYHQGPAKALRNYEQWLQR